MDDKQQILELKSQIAQLHEQNLAYQKNHLGFSAAVVGYFACDPEDQLFWEAKLALLCGVYEPDALEFDWKNLYGRLGKGLKRGLSDRPDLPELRAKLDERFPEEGE